MTQSPIQQAPPPAPAPRAWPLGLRGLIIGGGALLCLLGLLLWPIARALNSAIVAAIEGWAPYVGGAVLLFGLATLLAIARSLLAIGRGLEYKAQQAAILRLANDMPAHVADVRAADHQRGLVASLLDQSLAGYYAAQLAAASREHPQLTTFHQAIHYAPPAQLGQAEAEAQPQLPQLESGRGTLAQLHQRGHVCRSGNSLLIGYAEAQPQYIELPECGFIGIGGQPRVGKSSTTMLLISQAILSGWHVFVGDPHITKADGLLNRCRPLSGKLARQAVTPDEIASMIRLVDKIGKRRVAGDPDRRPVIMVIDEFSNLVWRGLLPDDVLSALPSMAAEYAGVGVHGVLIAHDWSKASLGGDLGAALRRAITHRLIHRMDPGNTEFLLPRSSSATSRAVQGLAKGHALAFGPDGMAMVAVPWIAEDDTAYAAGGASPRPYEARPQLGAQGGHQAPPAGHQAPPAAAGEAQASSIPPTWRVAAQPQQAALTEQLTITVGEQILGLLLARPWLTSTEIATALAIDLKVVRTNLTPLERGRAIERRHTSRPVADKYEYAVNQSVNQAGSGLAPTA